MIKAILSMTQILVISDIFEGKNEKNYQPEYPQTMMVYHVHVASSDDIL